jgi:hypothetical protein
MVISSAVFYIDFIGKRLVPIPNFLILTLISKKERANKKSAFADLLLCLF